MIMGSKRRGESQGALPLLGIVLIIAAIVVMLLVLLRPARAEEKLLPINAVNGDAAVKVPRGIPDRDKVRLREAQLRQQEVLTQLLQSPLYAAFQAAQTTTAQVVADIERNAGCKLDVGKAECEPPKEASKPKP